MHIEDSTEATKSGSACTKKKSIILIFILNIIILASICTFLYSFYRLLTIEHEYKAGTDEYRDLQKFIRMPSELPEGILPSAGDSPEISVDFSSLKAINNSIAGWIYFKKTSISYPIVKGTDNIFYLSHTFKKEHNCTGCIFMDCTNSPDFTDFHTIIYGHNMKNGSMFAILNNYQNKNYFDANPCFWICTPEGTNRYDIFSCYNADVSGESYKKDFASVEDYSEFLKKITEKSIYNTGVVAEKSDTIVSLSTCSSQDRNKRFIVHAKKTPK